MLSGMGSFVEIRQGILKTQHFKLLPCAMIMAIFNLHFLTTPTSAAGKAVEQSLLKLRLSYSLSSSATWSYMPIIFLVTIA